MAPKKSSANNSTGNNSTGNNSAGNNSTGFTTEDNVRLTRLMYARVVQDHEHEDLAAEFAHNPSVDELKAHMEFLKNESKDRVDNIITKPAGGSKNGPGDKGDKDGNGGSGAAGSGIAA